MLRLDLVKLGRDGSLRVQAVIPEDSSLWEGSHLRFANALDVDLEASTVASGGVLIRGTLSGAVKQDCTRCLKPLRVPVAQDVTMLFAPQDELGEGDSEIRRVDAKAAEIELDVPVLEELVLRVPEYAVCSADCKGLCHQCGVDLHAETCQCAAEMGDPRWDALRP